MANMDNPNWKSRAKINYIKDYPNEVDMIEFRIETELDRLETDIEMLQASHGVYRTMIRKDVAHTREVIMQHVESVKRLCLEARSEDVPYNDPSLYDPSQIDLF